MVCFALKHYPESLPKAWYARRKAACDTLFQNVLPKCNAIIGERYRSLHSGAHRAGIPRSAPAEQRRGHRDLFVIALDWCAGPHPQSSSEDHAERDETARSLTLPPFGSAQV